MSLTISAHTFSIGFISAPFGGHGRKLLEVGSVCKPRSPARKRSGAKAFLRGLKGWLVRCDHRIRDHEELGGVRIKQRRLDLPDATTQVLQGLLFVSILASEALYGRINWRLRPLGLRTRGPAPASQP